MQILEPKSLALTLRTLEQARLAGGRKDNPEVSKALDWIVSRRAYGPNSAATLTATGNDTLPRPRYFAATELDFVEKTPMPTGEAARRDCTRSILGFEAARALIVWGRTHDWPAEKVTTQIRNKRHAWPPTRVGYYCCENCSVGRWRVLAAARISGWEDVVSGGLHELLEQPFQDGRGWHGYPLYYTLLTLSEIHLPDVNLIRRIIRPTAKRLSEDLSAMDACAKFRRRALDWALDS
jgi:hypothetical protein